MIPNTPPVTTACLLVLLCLSANSVQAEGSAVPWGERLETFKNREVVRAENLPAPAYAPQPTTNKIVYPPLIDSRDVGHKIELDINKSQHEFFPGVKSDTMSYGGTYLGPVIRLYNGEDTTLTYNNNLPVYTTVHGHGLLVSGDVDGGPEAIIEPNGSRTVVLPIRQEAGTSWFHPHPHGHKPEEKTGGQVLAGLAGMYIIEDDNSASLNLPKTYGVNDLPLIIQDRAFKDQKMLVTEERGDTMVVNGVVSPYAEVPEGMVRLRLLNGSNERMYVFSFSDGRPFAKIATEGGFLNQPVFLTEMIMAAGERNEIVVDFSDGKNADLIAKLVDESITEIQAVDRIVEFRVNDGIKVDGTVELPEVLNTMVRYQPADAIRNRDFVMRMDLKVANGVEVSKAWFINNKQMNMSVINDHVKKGELERWFVTRVGAEEIHTFHPHGTSFQILSYDGMPPAPEDRGWKDVVTVPLNASGVEILVKFDHLADNSMPYMYHCHMLEHEGGGMMGQFTVNN